MNTINRLLGRSTPVTSLPHQHDKSPNFKAPTAKFEPRALQLDIIVGARCPICQENLKSLEELRRLLPNVQIQVVDIDAPGARVPKNVIAIPTFLLNGSVVATGNANVQELKQFVDSLA
jgi:predicted thioredoxin/glutaredoxin